MPGFTYPAAIQCGGGIRLERAGRRDCRHGKPPRQVGMTGSIPTRESTGMTGILADGLIFKYCPRRHACRVRGLKPDVLRGCARVSELAIGRRASGCGAGCELLTPRK
jgi:hypothetical protein